MLPATCLHVAGMLGMNANEPPPMYGHCACLALGGPHGPNRPETASKVAGKGSGGKGEGTSTSSCNLLIFGGSTNPNTVRNLTCRAHHTIHAQLLVSQHTDKTADGGNVACILAVSHHRNLLISTSLCTALLQSSLILSSLS